MPAAALMIWDFAMAKVLLAGMARSYLGRLDEIKSVGYDSSSLALGV